MDRNYESGWLSQYSDKATSWKTDVRLSARAGGLLLFTTESRSVLRSAKPPIQEVPGAISPGREANHLLPSSAEAKNECSYTSTPPIGPHGVVPD
jgi:hypothetical protein